MAASLPDRALGRTRDIPAVDYAWPLKTILDRQAILAMSGPNL
jgi:hypothetical protein